jgi:hypothetical protein
VASVSWGRKIGVWKNAKGKVKSQDIHPLCTNVHHMKGELQKREEV